MYIPNLARIIVLAGALWLGFFAQAQAADSIRIKDCWIRQLPGKLPAAAYFRIMNTGNTPVALTAVATDAYAHTMLHTTREQHGMSHMHPIHQVAVPAQAHIDFSPGGHHVMLEQAQRSIAIGETLTMRFVFSPDSIVTGQCVVRTAKASRNPHKHQH